MVCLLTSSSGEEMAPWRKVFFFTSPRAKHKMLWNDPYTHPRTALQILAKLCSVLSAPKMSRFSPTRADAFESTCISLERWHSSSLSWLIFGILFSRLLLDPSRLAMVVARAHGKVLSASDPLKVGRPSFLRCFLEPLAS